MAPAVQSAASRKGLQAAADALISPTNLKNNIGVLSYFRTFVSVILGAVAGILGITGWSGFILHFVAQLLCAGAMLLKGAVQPINYFHTWSNLLFFNVFSQITLLSFILFWMIFYNLCHVFA